MAYKSKFNYIKKKDNNSWIFFNTLTNALIILDEKYKLIYDNFPNFKITEQSEFISKLIELGFLNDDDNDEIEIVNSIRKKNAYNSKSAYLRVLTTTGCNARCHYCYENGFNHETMTIDTSNTLVKFILSQLNLEKFYIHWFGGEPLLNVKIIDNVMNKVYKNLEKNGTKVYVYFTSNGSLLTEQLVHKAKKDWHVNWFQITIDDIGKKYDVVKNYINNKYNFDLVIENIGHLLKNDIKVILRINYLPNEINKVKEVINFIYDKYKKFCDNKILIFSPAPIFNMCDDKKIGIKEQKNYNTFEPNKYLMEKGLLSFDEAFGLVFKSGQCYACHHNSFVVDPLGKLYKCTVTIKEKDACVGDIYNGIDKNEYYYKWVNPQLPDECNKCTFLPICQGGCRAGYLGYMNVSCKRVIKEIDSILEYRISLNITDKKEKIEADKIYLD